MMETQRNEDRANMELKQIKEELESFTANTNRVSSERSNLQMELSALRTKVVNYSATIHEFKLFLSEV